MRMTGTKTAAYCAAIKGGAAAGKNWSAALKQVRRSLNMVDKKMKLTKALLSLVGIAAVAGAAAVVGVAAGLKKWAGDEDSDSIKLALGGKKGIAILKGEAPGTFTVDTNYDWQNDPEFADILDDDDDDEDEEDYDFDAEELKEASDDGDGIEVEIEIKKDEE